MITVFWKNSLLPFLILVSFSFGLKAQGPQYDLRFVHHVTDCVAEEIFIDLEIKASTPTSTFGLGLQNYKFNFNLTTVPAISPPIGPPNSNPPDQSVYISQELTISGSVAGSLYAVHTLTGSSGNLVSYNVNILSGPGYPITFDTWVPIGRLRMNLADPMPPCLNLEWDFGNTLVLTGSVTLAAPGTLNNLTICGICQSLPIELAHFDITKSGCEAVLEWKTLTETNNSHFIIERSQDGKTFEEIGQVEGSGNSSSLNYYRIRQVDSNGESRVSEIKIIHSPCNDAEGGAGFVSVYPNPVSPGNEINITVNAPEEGTFVLEVMDAKMQIVKKYNFNLSKGSNLLPLHLVDFDIGLHFLRFVSPEWQSDSARFIISK